MLSLPRAQVLVAGKETKTLKPCGQKEKKEKNIPLRTIFQVLLILSSRKLLIDWFVCCGGFYIRKGYQSIWGFFTHPTITPFPNLSLLPLHRADKRGQTISDFHRIREDPSSSAMWQFLCLRLLHFPSLQLPKPPALRDPWNQPQAWFSWYVPSGIQNNLTITSLSSWGHAGHGGGTVQLNLRLVVLMGSLFSPAGIQTLYQWHVLKLSAESEGPLSPCWCYCHRVAGPCSGLGCIGVRHTCMISSLLAC